MAEENRAFYGFSQLEGNFRKGLLDARVREVGGILNFRFSRDKKKFNKSREQFYLNLIEYAIIFNKVKD